MSKYDDLVKKLKEIFQIDRPELDFGVYRILNARVVEINDYLENRLKAKVNQSLAASGAANKEGVQKELKEKEAQYLADGIDPETVPKVRELRQKLADYGAGTPNTKTRCSRICSPSSPATTTTATLSASAVTRATPMLFPMLGKKWCCTGRIKISITPRVGRTFPTMPLSWMMGVVCVSAWSRRYGQG